jgi:hypothetical protein
MPYFVINPSFPFPGALAHPGLGAAGHAKYGTSISDAIMKMMRNGQLIQKPAQDV